MAVGVWVELVLQLLLVGIVVNTSIVLEVAKDKE